MRGKTGNVGARATEEGVDTEGKIYTVVPAGLLIMTWNTARAAGTELAEVPGNELARGVGSRLDEIAGNELARGFGVKLAEAAGKALAMVLGVKLAMFLGTELVIVLGAELAIVSGAELAAVLGAKLTEVGRRRVWYRRWSGGCRRWSWLVGGLSGGWVTGAVVWGLCEVWEVYVCDG